MVKVVVVVEVKAKSVDASGSDSTKGLSDKSDANNFSKNVFQALHSDMSCHVEL